MLLWGGRDTCKNIPKGPGSKQRPRSDARLPRVLWQWRPPPPLLPSPTSAPHTPGPGVRAYGGSSISLTVKCLVPQEAKGAKAWRAAGLEAAHAMVAKGWSWSELATLCVPEVPNLLQIRCPHHPTTPPPATTSTALPDWHLCDRALSEKVMAESESLKEGTFHFWFSQAVNTT